MGATRSTLRDRIRNAYRETSGVNTTDGEVNQWIQQAHDDLAETKYYKRVVTASLAEDQEDYDVSALQIIELDQVAILQDGDYDASGTYKYIIPLPYWKYKKWMRSIETAPGGGASGVPTTTGTPTHYALDGKYAYLYPCPSYDEDEGLKLTFAGCQLMDEDADTTELPRQFEYLVTCYGLSKWYEKDDNPQVASYHMGMFLQGKQKLYGYVDSMKISGPSRIAIPGTERRIRVS